MKRCAESLAAAACLALAACASSPPAPSVVRVPRAAVAKAAAADEGKGDPQLRFAAALQLMKDGRREEAETALIVLSQDFPQFSGPATDLGILYAQARKRGPALQAFARAVQANPGNVVALNWLGVLSRESGDYARAEQYYRRAVTAQPDFAPAHLNLAILYDVSLHQPERALEEYRRYRELAGLAQRPMVAVWIRELESRTAVAASAQPPAGAQK